MKRIFGIFVNVTLLTKVFVAMKKIILVEKEEVLRKDSKISDTFNNYFVNITDKYINGVISLKIV